MKVSNQVYMLEVTGPRSTMWPVLLKDENDLILIDTAYPVQSENLQKAIEAEGFSLSELTQIFITHHDIDHIGCVNDLLQHAPDAKIWASEWEAPYIRGEKPAFKITDMQEKFESMTKPVQDWYGLFKEQMEAIEPVRVDELLQDGDLLPFCGGIRVVATPGHTPGHLCYYVEKDAVLIPGDTLTALDQKLLGPKIDFTCDMELALRSDEKLRSLGAKKIVCIHGGIVDGEFPSELIANIW